MQRPRAPRQADPAPPRAARETPARGREAQAPREVAEREEPTAPTRAVATLEREPEVLPGGSSEHRTARRFSLIEQRPAVAGTGLREAWRATRAGLETVVLSWLIAVVPVVAAYVATVASPVLGESSWADATAQGTRAWLLGWGEPFPVAEAAPVTLVPLVLPLIAFALVKGAVRRAELLHAWSAVIVGAVMVVGIAVGYLAVSAVPTVRGTLIALVLVAASVARGWFALPGVSLPGPVTVHRGLRAAGRALGGVLLLALVSVVVTILRDLPAVLDLHQALRADVLSGSLLVLAEVALIPTLAVWAMAWWLAPGFSLGLAHAAPTGVTEGPLPVVPILAAFPDAGPGPGLIVVVVPMFVVAGVLAVALVPDTTWRERAITGAVAVTGWVAGATILAWLSGGWSQGATLGPLSDVGTAAASVAVAALVVGLVGAGAGLGISLGLQHWGVPERAGAFTARHLGPTSALARAARAARHPLRTWRDSRR